MSWRKNTLALVLALFLLAACRPQPTVTVYVERQTEAAAERSVSVPDTGERFVLNPASQRIHRPGCVWADRIDPDRRIEYAGDRQTLIEVGYRPCHYCKP